MGKYIDGFLLPIKAENVEQYKEMAQVARDVWMEHGALEYVEAQLDDAGHDEMIAFSKSADAQDGETVIFAYIVYASKEDRDRINASVMEDERMKAVMKTHGGLFDFKRMAYGGFKAIVEA